MASLLGNGFDDPQSAAIMALAGGLLRRDFGGGLLAANSAFGEAKNNAARQQMAQMQMQEMQMRMADAQRQRALEEQLRGAAQQSFITPEQATAASMGPMPDGSNMPTVQPGFDAKGYGQRLMAIDPMKGLAWQQATAKDETPITVAPGASLVDRRSFKPVFTAPDKPEKPPADWQLYQLSGAAARGIPFDQWDQARRRAAATNVNVDNKAVLAGETEWQKKRAGSQAEMMENINKQGFAAPAQIRKLERMSQLLEGVDGGKLAPTGLEVASALNSLGIKVDPRLGNKEAAQALAREIAGGFRQPGTGPMTDKDFENFLLQVPDLSKTAQGRKQITATMKAALARDIEVSKRARAYVAKNGRLDDGFLDEISQFIAENPVIQMPKTWEVSR